MPFTISHLAAAPPIGRLLGRQLPLVALAVGAMSPDLEFFLRGRIERTIGHTAHGAVLLDVPLGLAFLAATAWLVVPAIQALLPSEARYLSQPLARSLTIPSGEWRELRSVARIVLALLIGAGSHIVWDVFTQPAASDPTGEPYRSLAWLDRLPFSIGQADFALHSVLHWVSTVVGLVVVMVSAERWIVRHRPAATDQAESEDVTTVTPANTTRAGWAIVGVFTAGFLIQHPIALVGGGPARPSGLTAILATSGVWAVSGCFVGLAAFGALLRLGVISTTPPALPTPPDPAERTATVEASMPAPKSEPLRSPGLKPNPLGPRSSRPRR